MKLPVAVVLGAIASVAMPYALRHASGPLGGFMRGTSRTIRMDGVDIRISLMMFLIVTLFSWIFFAWSDR